MAKILVADDNSNIQKMVGLALKDQGIEVIAVGNGEAAVRKIADLRPDLVLADVFMPVRNGYEVCKFVKDDASLAHIPVILLVGAFDPLDEQEAQRVGADGVLKKPFVPPDPLISMVKSALTRAGVVLGAAGSPVAPPPMPVAAKPVAPPTPKVVPPPPTFTPEPEEPVAPTTSSSRHATLTIEKGAQPLAFGSLLETQTSGDDTVFSVTPSAPAVPERNWGESAAAADEPVEEEEESKNASWRLSSIEDAADQVPAGQKDWREAAFAGIGTEQPSKVEWAPSIEKNTLSITEDEAAELAKSQKVFSDKAASRGPEDWSKAIGEVFPATAPAPREVQVPQVSDAVAAPASEIPQPAAAFMPEQVSEPVPVPEIARVPETAPAAAAPEANSWMAGAVSPWEAEIQRAAELAATWDSAKIAPAAVVEESSATEAFLDSGLLTSAKERVAEAPTVESPAPELAQPEPEVVVEEAPAVDPPAGSGYSAEPLITPATEEILQQETANVVAEELPALQAVPAAEVSAASEPAPVEAPNMDDIVSKVLARMNPDALQAVTRQILKPIVEAMIKDELNNK